VGVHAVDLLEAATRVGVLFIVIGYMPAVYSAFSRRETAMSQLATRAGSPPAATSLLQRAAARGSWRHLERDLQAWEEWAAELMETHLTYPLLAFYRSQHLNQNWPWTAQSGRHLPGRGTNGGPGCGTLGPPCGDRRGPGVFPDELYQAPRSWAERAYPHNLIYYNRLDRGGHFAAWEQPGLFAAEMRAAFKPLRK
jgi:hypothetical protein